MTRSGVSLRLSGGGSGVAEKFWMWMLPTGATIAEEGSEFGKYHAGYDNEGGRMTLKLYIDMLYKHNCDSFKIKHDSEALALERDAGMMATTNLNVSGKSKVQDLAWDFALYTQRDEYLQAVIDKVGWFPAKTMDYTDVLKNEPRFDPFVNIPDTFQGFSYPHTTTADEIYTKLANKLTPAFQNKNLVDNPDGIAKVIRDAAAETNEILEEAGEFGM